MPSPQEAIVNRRDFLFSCLIFACAVVMLVTHAQTGLTVALIGALTALLTLLAGGKYAAEILKRVDYETLLFFIGLFVVVGGPGADWNSGAGGRSDRNAQSGESDADDGDYSLGFRCGQRHCRQHSFCRYHGSGDQKPCGSAGSRSSDTCLGALHGYGYRRKRHTHRSFRQCSGASSVAGKNGYLISWGKYCKAAIPATLLVLLISMLVIFLRYC